MNIPDIFYLGDGQLNWDAISIISIILGIFLVSITLWNAKQVIKYIQKHLDVIVWGGIILILLYLVYLIKNIECCYLSDDLRWNFIAEVCGILLTIILLYFILGYKDKYKWSLVEGVTHDFFRKEMQLIYMDISLFLEGGTVVVTSDEFKENEEENFYKILKERAESQELKLCDNALTICTQNNYDELFELRRKNLDMLELKYSKFLSPGIVHDLVLIEHNLYRAALDIKLIKEEIKLIKEDDAIDDIFLTRFKQNLHDIIKQIYKLYIESKVEIYYYE